MGGRLCYAVYPGDAATALIPLDARVKLATPAGIKELTVEQLVPGDMMVDGRIQSHVVRSNEILTEVTLPPPRPGARMSFQKLRPRGVWDFAMAALAINLHIERDVVQDARIVFGGIAGRPVRETNVEDALKGQRLGPGAIDRAQGVALAGAAPLKYNAMKIEMAKGLLASGLDRLSTQA
jgi:xanthine dehydrogenase YagS FAD-binding subunit